jgi:hydrogenase maturation protease
MVKQILILGIGNLLMGDEGVGVHVVRYLEMHAKPEQADILDGGTGGFTLLGYFQQYPKIILVDATIDGQKAGNISLLKPKFSSDYPPTLTAHDIGLKDLLDALYLTDHQPEIWLYTISIEKLDRISLELSPEIERIVPEVCRRIARTVEQLIMES